MWSTHQTSGEWCQKKTWSLGPVEREAFSEMKGLVSTEIRNKWRVPCCAMKSPFRTEWLARSVSVGPANSYQLSLGIVLKQGEPSCFTPVAPLPRDNTHLEVWAPLPVWDSESPSQLQNSPWACWGLCSDHTASLLFPQPSACFLPPIPTPTQALNPNKFS